MKKWLVIIGIILALSAVIYFQFVRIQNLNEKFEAAQNNTKALITTNSNLDSTCRTLKMTMEQLEYSNDSISKLLMNTIKSNELNKKKIKQLQYSLSTNFRIDTVTFRDTLFREYVDLDTTISDNKWYSLNLKLKSPSTFIVDPRFVNENVLTLSYKKETVNPPRKFFLWRWFQKKHIVTEGTVINNNPYCKQDTLRIIEVVKY